jgi:dephospho-CoA kinase
MRIYGLTGGTGSGKSEAARRFTELGIPVLDADAIGHEVIAPGGPAEPAAREVFGDEILSDGRIDRVKLGALVFSDPEARRRLNDIVHPAIRMEIAIRCASLAEAGHALAIIDAALLAENGRKEPFLDGLIVVTCAARTRARRLIERCGLDEDEVRRRFAAQTPPENKVAIADWVIDNNGTIEALRARVDEVARELLGDESQAD